MPTPNLLHILLLLLPTPSHAQTITPAPAPDLLRRQQSSSPSTSSLDRFSAMAICNSAAPCTSLGTLNDVCEAEYGRGDDYSYCLCTRGYYDMISACDACSLSLGIGLSEFSAIDASRASEDRSLCSGYATEFGANATIGKGTGITSKTYPSSPIGVGTRMQSVGSDVPFGGLVSTGAGGFAEVATATATATGSESRGARTQGVPSGLVLSVALSMLCWGNLF